MGLPCFPTGTTGMTRNDVVNQVISSIAMEELGLSHIINAEGEKIQYVIGTIPGITGLNPTVEEILLINKSVQQTLSTAVQNQMFLNDKLSTALDSDVLTGPTGQTGPTGPTGPALELDSKLVTVIGTDGSSADLNYSDKIIFSSENDSVDVKVATGSVLIDISTSAEKINSVPSVGENNNWYVDGVDTGKSSVGITGATGATGVTGGPGIAVAQEFSTGTDTDTNIYLAGQIISYNNLLYLVMRNDPQGVPGSSEDFMVLLRIEKTTPAFQGTERAIKDQESYTIPANSTVFFTDSIYSGNANVKYDGDTGAFSILQQGSYIVNWWLSVYGDEFNSLMPGLIGIDLGGKQYSTTGFNTMQGPTIVVGNSFISVQEPTSISLKNYTENIGFVLRNGNVQGEILITQVA